MNLTSKQEKAAKLKAAGESKSDAYRGAGYKTDEMKAETLHRRAHELFDNGKVAARVVELEGRALKRHDVTVDSLTEELELARVHALKDEKGGKAAIDATMAKARLHGLVGPEKGVSPSQPPAEPVQPRNDMKGALDKLSAPSTQTVQ